MHLKDGQIRAFLDHEASEQEQVHLDTCRLCQARLASLAEQTRAVHDALNILEPDDLKRSQPEARMRAQLTTYFEQKENQNMMHKIFSRKTRPAWVGFGIIAILALAMLLPPVQAIANNFLGLFRVEQVTIVRVDPMNLPQDLHESANLEAFFTDDMQFVTSGEQQVVENAGAASAQAGIPVRLPAEEFGDFSLEVKPPATVTFQVNLARIQAILDEFDLNDVELPEAIDGAVVTVELPAIVFANAGQCGAAQDELAEKADPDEPESFMYYDCLSLVQMTSPTVTAPPGVDLQRIGQIYLEFLGMDTAEAAQFSQNIDWSTTLVLPLPTDGYEFSEVPVNGVTGTLISSTGEGNRSYTLMWVSDGVTYVLTGLGSTSTALAVAESIQ